MISVFISYTVRPDFVEENKRNINNFLEDLKTLNSNEFQYNVYIKEDGLTFLHQSTYIDENIQTIVLNTPSFRRFRTIRDEKGLDNTHQVEVLTLVGSSNNILKSNDINFDV